MQEGICEMGQSGFFTDCDKHVQVRLFFTWDWRLNGPSEGQGAWHGSFAQVNEPWGPDGEVKILILINSLYKLNPELMSLNKFQQVVKPGLSDSVESTLTIEPHCSPNYTLYKSLGSENYT